MRAGDFWRLEGKIGTVEEIDLRATGICILDRSTAQVPKAVAGMQIENFGDRENIWEWREKGELCLPDFPDEEIQALR